jgi:osmotically-inducible protein OsmY
MALLKLTTFAMASALVLLTACDQKETGTTAGEKLDSAIVEGKQESSEAGAYVEDKTTQTVQVVDDAAITTALKAKLVADADLKALDINVDTVGGVVTLTGMAPSATAKDRATQIARTVDGVSNVNNNLTVQ